MQQVRLAPTSRSNSTSQLIQLLLAGRRQALVIILPFLAALGVAGAMLHIMVPEYVASAVLFVDNRKVHAVQDAYDFSATGFDPTDVGAVGLTKILKSDNIVRAVVKTLLADPAHSSLNGEENLNGKEKQVGPAPISPPVGVPNIRNPAIIVEETQLMVPALSSFDGKKQQQLMEQLKNGLTVRRFGRVIFEVSFQDAAPATAAKIANAFANEYVADQIRAKFEATRRASSWLEERISTLKQQVESSELAVQRFKADHGLVATGGNLHDEQRLGDINGQLMLLRSETAKLEARYEQIKTLIDGRQADAVIAESIGNAAIGRLREKYLASIKAEREIVRKLGPDHTAAVNLRAEMRQYQTLMFEELGQIAKSYQNELEIARSREKNLSNRYSEMINATSKTDETLVRLRELERESASYRTLYATYLQRHGETIQQQSFPITEARVISAAQVPLAASGTTVIRYSLIIGLLAGVALAAMRESYDRSFRTARQVQEDLGLELIGMLPHLKSGHRKDAARRMLPGAFLQHGSEALYAAKIAIDEKTAGTEPKTIGIIAAHSGEGCSTVAKNIAAFIAIAGFKTLLIDANTRKPDLTHDVAPAARRRFLEVLEKPESAGEALLSEPGSMLATLPAAVDVRSSQSSRLLSFKKMTELLSELKGDFAYVVLDLPPLGPYVDVRAIASQIDAFVLVVEWGKSSREMVHELFESQKQARSKCVGVLFNKVRFEKLKLYGVRSPDRT